MSIWKKLTQEKIRERVFEALQHNVDYYSEKILGIPASHLDDKVFYQDAPFLVHAPFLSTLIHNPNHIGCHTLGESESFFKGTQELEEELIRLCAEDIFKGEENQFDGYVASGGTEANMQAVWIYRNYFMAEYEASPSEIAILCSTDAHYSVDKASNVFNIRIVKAQVDEETRIINRDDLAAKVDEASRTGVKYFICVANMMTTMFGSVDSTEDFTIVLKEKGMPLKLHVDGAYGGFFYPFADKNSQLNFANPDVNSITLDAHKKLQAPYGTGIFLIRKNWIHYANTKEASYVEGQDYTLSGSRSGANAVAIWMILMTYGPNGWFEKMFILNNRAKWLAEQLDDLGVAYFWHEHSNILTIKWTDLDRNLAVKYGLVPDNHHDPKWYKIVIMDHVTIEKMEPFLDELKEIVNQDNV